MTIFALKNNIIMWFGGFFVKYLYKSNSGFFSGLFGSIYGCRLSRVELDELIELRLSRLLSFAINNTRFYSELLCDNSSGLQLLRKFRPVDKECARNNFHSLVSNGLCYITDFDEFLNLYKNGIFVGQRLVLSTTSGTTGGRSFFLNSFSEINFLKGIVISRNISACHGWWSFLSGFRFRRFRMMFIVPDTGPFITHQLPNVGSFFSKILFNISVVSIFESSFDLLEHASNFKPDYIHAYPSILSKIVDASESSGVVISPDFVSMSSEPLNSHTNQKLKKYFAKAKFMESYSATEMLAIASRCSFGQFHLNEDYCYIELYKYSGEPCLDGDYCDYFLLTNFVNLSNPVIRRVISDRLCFVDAPCGCGSKFRIISIEGRTDDYIVLRNFDGDEVRIPPIPFEISCMQIQGLHSFQVVQNSIESITIYFESPPGKKEIIASEVVNNVNKLIDVGSISGVFCVVNAIWVDEIPRSSSGKFRQIISNVDL